MVAALSLNNSFLKAIQPSATTVERAWNIVPLQHSEVAELKAMFWQLHAFNSSLDPRFALSESWEEGFDSHLAEILQGRQAICFMARDRHSGRPTGFVLAGVHSDSSMWKHREWAEIEALFVDKEWRGSGLAQELLDAVYDWAEKQGQSVVQLYVTATNERAINLYQNEGFRPVQQIMRKVLN